jgi:hypothetical protein
MIKRVTGEQLLAIGIILIGLVMPGRRRYP